jgi:hypothetical protein
MAAYVRTRDTACGWCKECDRQVGDWPVCGPWPVTTSIWLHTNGTGHHVRRVSYDEAWAAVLARQDPGARTPHERHRRHSRQGAGAHHERPTKGARG